MGDAKQGSFFAKFLSVLSGKPSEEETEKPAKSPHAPEEKDPVDLTFVKRFTDSGSKFLYCEKPEEVYDYLGKISEEAQLKTIYCKDLNLQSMLSHAGLSFEKEVYKDANAVCCGCEFLISFNGAIMISENQTRGVKLSELPETFICIAYTSQIVENLRYGLTGIRQKYTTLPGQLTTIKGPRDLDGIEQGEHSSMCKKDIYLILIEDQA